MYGSFVFLWQSYTNKESAQTRSNMMLTFRICLLRSKHQQHQQDEHRSTAHPTLSESGTGKGSGSPEPRA